MSIKIASFLCKHVVDTAVIVAKFIIFNPNFTPNPNIVPNIVRITVVTTTTMNVTHQQKVYSVASKSFLGTVEIRPHLNGEGYKYIDTAALKLYKYNLREFSQKYTVDSLVGHRIATSYSSSNTRNFRVLRFIKKGVDADFSCIVDDTMFLNIAVFDVDVRCAENGRQL